VNVFHRNRSLPDNPTIAVIVARGGRLPVGADETVAEAGGLALVLGGAAEQASHALLAATRVWWCETGESFRAGALAHALASALHSVPLVLMPASPDGRDLAPRLASAMDRPLLAGAERVTCRADADGLCVDADLSRLDDQLTIPVHCVQPAVATLLPGSRSFESVTTKPAPIAWGPLELHDDGLDAQLIETIEPEPATIDLGEASRVFAGGAGLVPRGADAGQARAMFELLRAVAAALGASVGATRVATDAGWIGYDRQIGTTGVWIDPQLYVAFGISGASQHVGGLGAPQQIVSVNTDASAPMTGMSDLGIVVDAPALLVALARHLGIAVPDTVAQLVGAGSAGQGRNKGDG